MGDNEETTWMFWRVLYNVTGNKPTGLYLLLPNYGEGLTDRAYEQAQALSRARWDSHEQHPPHKRG